MKTVASLTVAVALTMSASTAAGQGFWDEVFEPWPDRHASPLGTPFVHPFFTEPAFIDRELIVDYSFANNIDGDTDEQELGIEVVLPITRRLGMIFEAPLIGLDPTVDGNTTGFGDLAVAGQALLLDCDSFLLSALVEVEIPTGDENRGLGRGETAISPTALVWIDLGGWTVFQGQFGPEIGLESGETELIYRALITRSWQCPSLLGHGYYRCDSPTDDHHDADHHHDPSHQHGDPEHGEHYHGHHEPGLFTLYLETTGVTNLTDRTEGTHFEIVPGLGYGLTEELELRAAARFPLYRPEHLDSQFILSVIRHF